MRPRAAYPTPVIAMGVTLIAMLLAGALWQALRTPILEHRLHGRWRSVEPVPALRLVLEADGRYTWGPVDAAKWGEPLQGRWRLRGDALEFSGERLNETVPFRMSMDRQMNSYFQLEGRWYYADGG